MARVPARARLATAISIPEVPVPDTANENAPSPARNTRPSRARTSSRIAIISGSRWLSTGADMARITRGATGLGPGPSSKRSMVGGMEKRSNPFSGVRGKRQERRTRIAARQSRKIERALEAGNAESSRDRARERHHPMLDRPRLVDAAGAHERKQLEAGAGHQRGGRDDPAPGSGAQRP